MKTLNLPCTCGMSGCTTRMVIEDDSEKKDNVLVRIIDDKHEYASFISMNKEDISQFIQRVRTKYKGV